jgi:hypothetical protein
VTLKTIQPQGGTAAQLNGETGPARSLAVDTETWKVRLFDGTTPGGRIVTTTGEQPWGAKGDGATDDSAVFTSMRNRVIARRSVPPTASGYPKKGNVVIEIPAGVFRLKSGNIFMTPAVNPTDAATGLVIRGQGRGITMLVFAPDTDQDLFNFQYNWADIVIGEMTIIGAVGADGQAHGGICYSRADAGASKEIQWRDIGVRGAWRTGIRLEGENNNSEWSFFNCLVANPTFTAATAFFHTLVAGVDQFFNYRWYSCQVWSNMGVPWIQLEKGGHVYIYACDCSSWGNTATTPTYLFNLMGQGHSLGSNSFHINGLRVEHASAFAKLLYSEWGNYGKVTVSNYDGSSLNAAIGNIADLIKLKYVNDARGAAVTFRDSIIPGTVNIEYAATRNFHKSRVLFDECEFMSQTGTIVRPNDAFTFTRTGGHSNYGYAPEITLRGCRPGLATGSNRTSWDCTISALSGAQGTTYADQGHPSAQLGRHVFSLANEIGGLPCYDHAGTPPTTLPSVQLPIGCWLQDCELHVEAGDAGVPAGTATFQLVDGDGTVLCELAMNSGTGVRAGGYAAKSFTGKRRLATASQATISFRKTAGTQNTFTLRTGAAFVTYDG